MYKISHFTMSIVLFCILLNDKTAFKFKINYCKLNISTVTKKMCSTANEIMRKL